MGNVWSLVKHHGITCIRHPKTFPLLTPETLPVEDAVCRQTPLVGRSRMLTAFDQLNSQVRLLPLLVFLISFLIFPLFAALRSTLDVER